MGVGGTLVVAFAVLFALTVLPSLLSVLGPRINSGRVPFPRFGHSGQSKGVWHRLATWVMRNPIKVLIPTTLLLLAMGLPFWRLQLAATDITALPGYKETRIAKDTVTDANEAQVAAQIKSGVTTLK
jgi:RND superfamily putative drug exporter